jgi:hypothetical protein
MKSSPAPPDVTADWHIPNSTTKAVEKKILSRFFYSFSAPLRKLSIVLKRIFCCDGGVGYN